ncbi:Glyoxylase, beta-lactamase superfamily II [Geodermatophilus saharensis]|uniref:Glyoxylase, beta-lactamase superfamily II n=1 Tax=Geodermatophilus saharensis TaxID=1137994 RepID=A0A239DBV2_9ACTN|nr:MBL fold metallo-hydrolase [Geodermatophilus saharensis]SNS29498.1 Glyoxylase, beta-lactamase superfamily II [Geodermatophilus saharensis]
MRDGLRELADGVWSGPTVPGPWINLVVVDDVVVDSGLRWSRRRLAGLLRGRDVAAHVVTHAHADHLGSTAWLCATLGARLEMGSRDADRFESGRIDTVTSRVGRVVARLAEPPRTPVDRRLREGDAVGSFRVLEVPGHSPGNIALWREADRTLVVGDAPVNLSRDPARPRWLHLPASLHHDAGEVRRSRRRLAELEPALVVPVHGHPVRDAGAWRRALTA